MSKRTLIKKNEIYKNPLIERKLATFNVHLFDETLRWVLEFLNLISVMSVLKWGKYCLLEASGNLVVFL